MSTVSPSRRTVKVVALLSRQRERVLLDEPLTLETLALLQPVSPLSKMFLDGAGLRFRPHGIAVYVDGKLAWQAKCNRHGATDHLSTSRWGGHDSVPTAVFTDAFPVDYDDERLAANRAAYELLRNDPDDAHWADDVASDLIEAAGSLRPKLRPPKPVPLPVADHSPCPCPVAGETDPTLGLPYHPSGSWRTTYSDAAGPGAETDVEFLPVGQ